MPFPSDPKPWSFYRLGPTKEKNLFKRRQDTYNGVVVPAHIASYYSKFCSEFIGSLRKPYFIDPMTYIFANDPKQLKRFVKDKSGRTQRDSSGRKKKGDIKRSYSKLVEIEYGGIIEQAVRSNRPVNPQDFTDGPAVEALVNNILVFQRDRLAAIPDKYKKYAKYAAKSGKKFADASNPPMCIVAPYFPTKTLDARGWYLTNVDLIRRTKAAAGQIPVFAVLLIDTSLLARYAQQIKSDYLSAGADGILLWPDGFSGLQDVPSLRVVFRAVQLLSSNDLPVILMYGDAFSLLLHYAGLTGYSCGICYGEKKDTTQDIDVEGVIPPRYYLSRLKKKVQIETEVRRIQINQYPDLKCDCEICSRKPDPAELDDTESREHFMLVRATEIDDLRRGLSQQDFTDALEATYAQYSSDPILHPLAHLRNWTDVLRGGTVS